MMLFFQDLSLVAQVPERLQERLDDVGVISFFGAAHGVEYQSLLLTEQQVQANRQQQLELIQAQTQAEQPAQPTT